MTDQRLRDLERDAARGDLQAQARLLLERVRVGDLTEERLRLAAYLGDEAARVAVGEEVERYAPEGHPILGLAWWGQRVCVLASVAAVRGAMALLGLDDSLVEDDLGSALRGEPSPARSPYSREREAPLDLVRSLRECAWEVSRASASGAAGWAKQLDREVLGLLTLSFFDLRESGRWDELFDRLSPRFPYTDAGGEAGVWRRAVLSHVPRELIPWALASRGAST